MTQPMFGMAIFRVVSRRWDADFKEGKEGTCYVVCKDIKAVWDYLTPDLEDACVEIVEICNVAPVVIVIPPDDKAVDSPE